IVGSNAKTLEVFKDMLPGGTPVAVLSNPNDAPASALQLRAVEAAAPALGLSLHSAAVSDPTEFDRAFTVMAREHRGALLVLGSPLFIMHRWRIAELAKAHGLPTMFDAREYVDVGGLMAYGPIGSYPERFRRAAVFVDKILKGAKPGDLSME